MGTDSYSATSDNMKLVQWPLMGGLFHFVQRGGDWADCGSAQSPPRYTKNSPPINGQCTNHGFDVPVKGLKWISFGWILSRNTLDSDCDLSLDDNTNDANDYFIIDSKQLIV